MSSFEAVIVDLGQVLFTWTAPEKCKISRKSFKQMLTTKIWHDYERGCYSEAECYSRLAKRFAVSESDLAEVFAQASNSLQEEVSFSRFLRAMKKTTPGLQVVALSNTPPPVFAALRKKQADWDLFDRIFTSSEIGARKPDIAIYQHVIETLNIVPQRLIFVDDQIDNVVAAESMGIRAILHRSEHETRQALCNLLGDPVSRGWSFLESHRGRLLSVTNTGVTIRENFAQLLILSSTRRRDLVDLEPGKQTWNFFIDGARLTTETFPDDLDTTSLAMSVVGPPPGLVIHTILDKMLATVNEEEILQVRYAGGHRRSKAKVDALTVPNLKVYFDETRPRVDPVASVNMLKLFYRHGRGHQVSQTRNWVTNVLYHRAYLNGTRYYSTAETFLYFLSGLCASHPTAPDLVTIQQLLKQRVQERLGTQGDALALAMRLLACCALGIATGIQRDYESLLAMQCEDGAWDEGWIYRYGSSGVNIGNKGLTTALAIEAIQRYRKMVQIQNPPKLPDKSSASRSVTSLLILVIIVQGAVSFGMTWPSIFLKLGLPGFI